MKKLISFLLCTLLCFSLSTLTVSASEESLTKIEVLEDGSYIETIITENSDISLFAASSTRTGSKTSTHKNSSGKVLWSVKVTGTFTYNGNISKFSLIQ